MDVVAVAADGLAKAQIPTYVVGIQSAVILAYLAQGYTVVTPDFEGPTAVDPLVSPSLGVVH